MSDTARITASYGRHYTVRTESGQTYTATARGKRVDFACGDRVHIEVQNGEQAVIRDFLPRRSLLYRQDAWRTKLIAANVDRLFIVTAAVPSPSEMLLQRALLAAEAGGIEAFIVLNKTDLPESAAWREKLAFYEDLGYPLAAVSALENAETLRPLLQGCTSIFLGQSGMGKSTLTNALVGAKIAITSGRPQTTRHNVRGVIHKENAQIVLVDTPGLHRPRTLLGKRLNDLVRETLTDVDVVVFCIPANEKIGPGDRFITRDLAELRTPVVAVVTKADTVTREALAAQLLAVSELGEWADIVPVSAQRNEQIDVLEEVLLKYMPLSPPLYPTGEITDEPQQVMIAELVREAALEGVRDELPHSLAVVVDEIADPDDEREVGRIKGAGGRLQVRVSLVVERDSQKAIIIGKGGRRLKEVGVTARKGIEKLLGRKVYLDLHVRTAKDWQSDPKALARLGF